MKNKILGALFLCAAFSSQAELLVQDTVNWNGSTYHLLEKSNWYDAQARAESLGGDLVTISSKEENDFIYGLWGEFGTASVTATYLWTGLNDEAQEGSFVWVSGEAVTYTNFMNGEPNDAGGREDHVYMWYRGGDTAGTWNDFPGHLGVDYHDGVFGVVEISNSKQDLTDNANAKDVSSSGLMFAPLIGLAFFRRRRSCTGD